MTRIFLDACIVIDLFEAKPEQQKVLTDALLGKTPYGSELVRMEARLQAVRDGRDELLARYDGYFERCRLVPFSRPLFDLASQLRIQHRIKTPDALHLAAAMMGACEQFWTNDDRLAKAASDRIAVWDWARIEQASSKAQER